jgi:hypothetical protein
MICDVLWVTAHNQASRSRCDLRSEVGTYLFVLLPIVTFVCKVSLSWINIKNDPPGSAWNGSETQVTDVSWPPMRGREAWRKVWGIGRNGQLSRLSDRPLFQTGVERSILSSGLASICSMIG